MKGIADDKGVLFAADNAIENLHIITQQTNRDYSKEVGKYADFIAFKAIQKRTQIKDGRFDTAKIKNPEYTQWREFIALLISFITFKLFEVYAPATHIVDEAAVKNSRRAFRYEWNSYKKYVQSGEESKYGRNQTYFFGELQMTHHNYRHRRIREHLSFMRRMRNQASGVELKEITLNDQELCGFANAKSFIEEHLEGE